MILRHQTYEGTPGCAVSVTRSWTGSWTGCGTTASEGSTCSGCFCSKCRTRWGYAGRASAASCQSTIEPSRFWNRPCSIRSTRAYWGRGVVYGTGEEKRVAAPRSASRTNPGLFFFFCKQISLFWSQCWIAFRSLSYIISCKPPLCIGFWATALLRAVFNAQRDAK